MGPIRYRCAAGGWLWGVGGGGGGQIRWTGVGWEVERRRGIRVLIL